MSVLIFQIIDLCIYFLKERIRNDPPKGCWLMFVYKSILQTSDMFSNFFPISMNIHLQNRKSPRQITAHLKAIIYISVIRTPTMDSSESCHKHLQSLYFHFCGRFNPRKRLINELKGGKKRKEKCGCGLMNGAALEATLWPVGAEQQRRPAATQWYCTTQQHRPQLKYWRCSQRERLVHIPGPSARAARLLPRAY